MICVHQIVEGRPLLNYLNPDNIERCVEFNRQAIPNCKAVIKFVSGDDIQVSETLEEIQALLKVEV
jgi:hypothetical protein